MTMALSVVATISRAVRTERMTFLIDGNPSQPKDNPSFRKAKSRVGQRNGQGGRPQKQPRTLPLTEAGPIVGNDDRIAGICGIVLHAGGITGHQALHTNLAFKTSDVLRGVIGDAGNRITVG